jgi:hypothetical protein
MLVLQPTGSWLVSQQPSKESHVSGSWRSKWPYFFYF